LTNTHLNSKSIIFKEKLVRAKIVKRPNRFILICNLVSTNEEVRVYLPNPGRMTELVFPGIEVLIRPNPDTGEEQKTSHTAIFLVKDDILYLVHSAMANDLVEKLLETRLIDQLQGYCLKKREFSLSFKSSKTRSRIDFLLEPDTLQKHDSLMVHDALKDPDSLQMHDALQEHTSEKTAHSQALVEVKNCNFIVGNTALFPDAPSIRASRHLNDLQACSDEYDIFSLVLVTGKQAQYFSPNFNTDPDFARAWFNTSDHASSNQPTDGAIHHICIHLDIKILNEYDDGTFEFSACPEPIMPDYDLVESRLDDCGAYIIMMEISDDLQVNTGALGSIDFKSGWYLYTGSAMKNLDKRVKRHLRKRKKFHWHIDYLMACTASAKALVFRDSEKRECDLARFMSQTAESEVRGFGCSDCSCSSHLFYFRDNPMKDMRFVDQVLEFGFRVK
jgi:sugar fermentation stimulation protein A